MRLTAPAPMFPSARRPPAPHASAIPRRPSLRRKKVARRVVPFRDDVV